VSPEPRPTELELDVASPEPRHLDQQLAAIGRRDGSKHLAVDTGAAAPLALRGMSKRELRAERDRVAFLLREAPPDRSRLVARTAEQRQQAEQGLAEATARVDAAQGRVAELGQGAGRLLRRRELTEARDRLALAETAAKLARQQADRAADRERQARRVQQEHQAWRERHADLLAGDRARARELAWRGRVDARVAELARPDWLRELGELPTTVKGQRAMQHALAQIEHYRERYRITDPERALGPNPAAATWSSAVTTGSPSRRSSGSRPGSAPSASSALAGGSGSTPTGCARAPREPTGHAHLASMSVGAAAVNVRPAERPLRLMPPVSGKR
jgi:hypothetical protein